MISQRTCTCLFVCYGALRPKQHFSVMSSSSVKPVPSSCKVYCSWPQHNDSALALNKVSKDRFGVRTTLEPLNVMSILKAMHQNRLWVLKTPP